MFEKLEIDFNSVGEQTSKRTLAKMLSVSTATIHSYHDVALEIEEFLNAYPQAGNDICTRMPLTKYQVWVMRELIKAGFMVTKKNVQINLNINPEFVQNFSFSRFQESI